MNKKYVGVGLTLCVALFCGGLYSADKKVLQKNKRRVVDTIVARVNGSNILKSHLEQPQISKGGETFSLKEAIDQEILFQKASERKLLPSSLDVEKYIAEWKRANHLTDLSEEEFEKRLRHDGLSGRRYRRQLGRFLAIRNLKQLEASERVIITSHEVEEYHKENPEYKDERYLLKTKIISLDDAKTENDAKKIVGKGEWLELDWIERSNLADKMLFVARMKEGEISEPLKVLGGHQFITLVKREEKRLMTLDERWSDIERVIQKGKMEKFEKEYIYDLRKKASIVYLDKTRLNKTSA